jgi:hypothetical protein
MTNLPTDTYYRGYRLTLMAQGTPTERIHIRQMGDPELIAGVPDMHTARAVIDGWLNAR